MLLARLAYALRRHLCPPDVIVDFIHEDGLLFVAVKNIGDGPAECVSVRFKPALTGIHGRVTISELALFNRLSFLPPGKEIRAFVDGARVYFEREAPTEITTSIRFEDEHGTAFHRTTTHDLSIYRELGFVQRATPDAPDRSAHSS